VVEAVGKDAIEEHAAGSALSIIEEVMEMPFGDGTGP